MGVAWLNGFAIVFVVVGFVRVWVQESSKITLTMSLKFFLKISPLLAMNWLISALSFMSSFLKEGFSTVLIGTESDGIKQQ